MASLAHPAHEDPDEAARAVRAERRTRQLLDAAARLMDRDGFHGVSMQALAAEASVSVGLIYRYFGGKDDLLLAVIVDVLGSFATRVPRSVAAVEDPVDRLAASFRAYCEVIDEHRHAAVLTYRESRTLSAAGRDKIKDLEVQTSEPLREAIRDGMRAGAFVPVDVDLVAHDMLLMAHGWALKHWYFERTQSFDDYVSKQTALVLNAILSPGSREQHQDKLALQ
ncbi:TetR/AcrR family transcriptional regulator [Saccharopolyspora rhizosphaerae]|uniref:TetR/AcrR family transcriptional regulator n=1 Tax=Saccharopolyspora rhizosphaerae TaxID=2492662 RepID=A0A426JM58_9PSEU|nr:TetR/AcrR family transcriptional regulator [Saccharopolyspora rhizosphaerae]RRO14309.1 TetR/AcrR family transcriptional regulator [Saccharopolyspora rhizosphaerae]